MAATKIKNFTDPQDLKLVNFEMMYTMNKMILVETTNDDLLVGFLHACEIRTTQERLPQENSVIVDIRPVVGPVLLNVEVKQIFVIAEAVFKLSLETAMDRLRQDSEP